MTNDTAAPLAVVTGASTGIGRAIAAELVERGYDVVIAAEEPAIHEAAAELARDGRTVTPVQVDLATAQGVEQLARTAREQGAPLDAVILNAGVGVNGRFDQTPLEDELNLVDLNVRSTVHLAKLLLPDLVARGDGRVLVTSSIAAVAPGPYHATYAASKAFVHSFAEGIREELKDTGVSVTSLMPGPTETEFFSRADMEDTKIGQMDDKDDPADVAREGVEAMLKGRSSVVGGSFANRVQAELGTHLPDALATPLMARMTKPQD
ncbi:SDR family oxidoreductase [Nocardioides sp. cx-173]|uniref:SDR family NAD(P)-dependent oxidoreductase n=1 Tax=Nocardioides sp. cx-173 TaxID=2898796 RepID=UPI001E585A75|nr:SDR family NAD(P)-dependent oxidoreductase [Nocardioides sp. cx-173]MCD4523548.1 SDR family NAD(P)-dependent oxidoreductase [Nocardioides sp. cx-173]UGB42114.1 SDR family NAD(P)-dependent oxidoreductase [Nocardioides sp. cx-173]